MKYNGLFSTNLLLYIVALLYNYYFKLCYVNCWLLYSLHCSNWSIQLLYVSLTCNHFYSYSIYLKLCICCNQSIILYTHDFLVIGFYLLYNCQNILSQVHLLYIVLYRSALCSTHTSVLRIHHRQTFWWIYVQYIYMWLILGQCVMLTAFDILVHCIHCWMWSS